MKPEKKNEEYLAEATGGEGMYNGHGMIREADALQALELMRSEMKELAWEVSEEMKHIANHRDELSKETKNTHEAAKLIGICIGWSHAGNLLRTSSGWYKDKKEALPQPPKQEEK